MIAVPYRSLERDVVPMQLGTSGDLYFISKFGTTRSVVKPGYAEEEYQGHGIIADYLPTVAPRLIEWQGAKANILKYIPSQTLSNLLLCNSVEESNFVFQLFLNDLEQMWRSSQVEFDTSILRKDYASITLSVIEKFQMSATAALLNRHGIEPDSSITINGLEVGSVNSYFQRMRSALHHKPQKACISHGDENPGNVLSPYDTQRYGKYRVIDYRFAGYYDPSWVVANIYSRFFLFNTTYPHDNSLVASQLSSSTFELDYHVNEATRTVMNFSRSLLRTFDFDETAVERSKAYAANNIGRSVAFLRDKLFHPVCENQGLAHFLTSMYEYKTL